MNIEAVIKKTFPELEIGILSIPSTRDIKQS